MYTPLLRTLLRTCVLALPVRTSTDFCHTVWRSVSGMAAVNRHPAEEDRGRAVSPIAREHATVTLRCTARLLEALGPIELSDADASGEDWYANLVWLDRRKWVLFVHAATLFPIYVPDVRVGDLRPIGPFMARHVHDALVSEHLPLDLFGPLEGDVTVARTASKSILASMNDMVAQARHRIRYYGHLDPEDAAALNKELRGTPYGARDYLMPRELAAQRAADRYR
jgi:hypothetical protein